MKPTCYLWAPLLLLLAVTGEVSAQSPNLESRVQELEETVRALVRRVSQLEDQLSQRSPAVDRTLAAAGATTPGASSKANWRRLQRGMSQGDVEKILGSPDRVNQMGGAMTVWYYGPGDVTFEGRTGTVSSWSEPFR